MHRHVCILLLCAVAAVPQTSKLEGLDAFITAEMKEWKVPGLAVAVVQGGNIVMTKGYGLRDTARNLPVTTRTLFAIGSITKSFTVTSLGLLVDDGRLDWDRPVREWIADFRLHDEAATERVTPRDLITHRTGVPRHDLLWYATPFKREQLYQRLRHLEPSKDLRSTFQYNNLMFMTAGVLAGRVAGLPWEDLVRQRILRPLEMTATNFSVEDSKKAADSSLPYRRVKEEIKEVPFRNIDEIGPAGSINSSIDDMARYLLFHLERGKYAGRQILSESSAIQMQTPQMAVQGGIQYSELGHNSYGMGWMVGAYRGRKLVSHGGGIDGFISLLSFLPEEKIGVMVLTNLSPNPLTSVVTYSVFDRLLGLDAVAWSDRFKKTRQQGLDAEEEARKRGLTPRKPGTRPSHELTDYAGTYEHPAYGQMRIEAGAQDLKLAFNRMQSPLKHFHYDVFEVPENPLDPIEKLKVQFVTGVSGDIDALTAALEPNVKGIVFARAPDPRMRERGFLEPFAGQYATPGVPLTVALKGEHTLVISSPGQPDRELLPKRGTTFEVKGVTGLSVEFRKDAEGRQEVVIYSPGGAASVAKKK